MFKKIISNLSFSPALVWQLGHYAKNIRKEEITRRLGLIFVILSLIIQSLIVFQSPEPANASNPNDMVTGGIGTSINGFLSAYDSNTKHLKDTANYLGITRAEIASTEIKPWAVGNSMSWGLLPHFGYSQGERQHNITDETNQIVASVYSRPFKLLTKNLSLIKQSWVGNSSKIGQFGIIPDSGDIVTNKLPSPLSSDCLINTKLTSQSDECKLCINNDVLLASSPSCTPNIIKSTTATNISQGFLDASPITAATSDQISYTVLIENTGLSPVTIKLSDNLSDILEYSTLFDSGGGTLDKSTNELSWSTITLDAKSKQTRTFVIKLFDKTPATAQGSSNPVSFDCKITNTFGNSIDINVDCPIQKTVETMINDLPKIDIMGNIIFAIILILIAMYLHARAHQIKKEIRLIRKDTNAGTI